MHASGAFTKTKRDVNVTYFDIWYLDDINVTQRFAEGRVGRSNMVYFNKRHRAAVSGLTSLVMTLGLAGPAYAQDASGPAQSQTPASPDQDVNDIVVTATRRSESVRDVPFNIQAISSEVLEKSGATDIADFARTVPGLSITDNGAREGVTLVLRGLRTGNEEGLAPTTTVYVDEVPMDMPYHRAPLDLKLIDMERVEVLRGPQGTLFGGGAIGGTVRYISKKPNFEKLEGRIGAELSSTRHGGLNYNATGMINVPVADWAAVRANFGRFDNDGFIDNLRLGTKNVNDDRTDSARIAIRLKPTTDLDIDISYYRQAARYGEANLQRESQPRLTVDFAHPGGARYKAQLANVTLGYDFGWANLTASSSFVDERLRSTNDSTFGIRDVIFGSFLNPADLPEITVITDRIAQSQSFTQEFRLVSSSDGPFAWILGGYYNRVRIREIQQELVPVPFPDQAAFEQNIIGAPLNDDKEYTYQQDDRTRQYAVFGELKYNFTDAWQASVGGRYFDIRGKGNFYSIDQWFGVGARDANGLARTIPLPEEFANGRYREKGSVWRFNTSYKFGRDGLVYATIAQGFRPGGFNVATPNTGIPPEGRQYDADDLVSYELGTKFSVLQNRIYVSADVFRIDWSDIQTTVRTPLGFAYLGNAGKAVSQGIEAELSARDILTEGLTLNVGYGYTDAKLTETISNIGFKNERMPFVPKHSISIMADYDTEIADSLKFGINASTTFNSSAYADFGAFKPGTSGSGPLTNPQYLPIKSYWLSNLSLRLENDDWSARLFADNIFDSRFKTSRLFVNANSRFSGPDIQFSANRPRTFGIELSRRF
jgi:iron complex outermembrane receptor protein